MPCGLLCCVMIDNDKSRKEIQPAGKKTSFPLCDRSLSYREGCAKNLTDSKALISELLKTATPTPYV